MKNENQMDNWRLTAYALGELDGEDQAAVQAYLDENPDQSAVVDEIAKTARRIESGLSSEEVPMGLELSPEQRLVIEGQASRSKAPAARPILGMRSLVATAAAVFLVAGVWYAQKTTTAYQQRSFAYNVGSGPSMNPIPASRRVAQTRQTDAYLKSSSAAGGTPALGRDSLTAIGYWGDDARADAVPTPSQRLALRQLGYAGLSEDHPGAPSRNRESYAEVREIPFRSPLESPLSTFAIDVDTASYANARRFIEGGNLPPKDAIRVEELINYFPYDYPKPLGETPFAVDIEVAGAPWNAAHRIVRIGLAGRPLSIAERKQSNLVFLIDVSGSMKSANKLPLLVRSMSLLVENLDARDTVAIVVYAGASGVALEPTSAQYPEAIYQALEQLSAGGSTNGGAGIELAYSLAAQHFRKGGINRVILATDGDFNVGASRELDLESLISAKAKTGVFLTVLGFGSGNLQDSKMETLANKGNGNYAYIDSIQEARKVLVEQMGGTLDTIAKDVKIQVEFNPSHVSSYRLIGYENRLMAAQDFRNDAKDAGEIGAGHTVTALYEVIPIGVHSQQDLRYRQAHPAPAGNPSEEMLTVSLRYKHPEESAAAEELTYPIIDHGKNFFEASEDTRFASAVAGFGLLLRGTDMRAPATFEDVYSWANEARGQDPKGYREAFLQLVKRAGAINR